MLPPHRRSTFHERIYIWTSVALFVCFLVALVGFASPAWRSGDFGTRVLMDTGLLMRCHHDRSVDYHKCAPFSMGSQNAWFETSRMFCAVSTVLLFALPISTAVLHVTDKRRQDFAYPLVAGVVAGLLGLIGAVVYAAMSENLFNNYHAQLSWGWAIFFVAHLFSIILSTGFIVVIRVQLRKTVPKPVAPRRDIIY